MLNPPSDPCMCGSFDGWHGACYLGLAQGEILWRHRAFVARWRKAARQRLTAEVLRRIDSAAKTP